MPTSKVTRIQTIQDLLRSMFDIVDEQLADALNVIQGAERGLSSQVRRRDDEVDALEMRIDREAEQVLLGRPERSRDVRFVMAAIKVNTDLERIGDHCKNIVKSADQIPRAALQVYVRHFDEMILGTRTMLYAAQDALFQNELDKAWQLVSDGHAVGRLHAETLAKIVDDSQFDGSFKTGARIYALTKALERIADHSVNIAESVLFWAEGVDVRHPRTDESPETKFKHKSSWTS